MRILIAERLRPFSHLPTVVTILPGLGYQVCISPCLIRCTTIGYDVNDPLTTVSLCLEGPLAEWTVLNDLEKGCITVSGNSAAGWIRYHLITSQNSNAVFLCADRVPLLGLKLQHKDKHYILQRNQHIQILGNSQLFSHYRVPPCARLSFGKHRKQDFEAIIRRGCFSEIFPIWHRLGQMLVDNNAANVSSSVFGLLEGCQHAMHASKVEHQVSAWAELFKVGFAHFLVPRSQDDDHQGILTNDSPKSDGNLFQLLTEGAALIQNLFIHQDANNIVILPHLWPIFPEGRLLDVVLSPFGSIDIEWSKKIIRRIILRSMHEGEIMFHFRSHVRNFRLREGLHDKGRQLACHYPIIIKKNVQYLFDNFQ